ncbi:Secreted protein [Pseudomonas gessardii]
MFGSQAILVVVFVVQRPVAVVDAEEVAEAVVGVIHGTAIGQGFSDKAAGVIALVGGNQLTVIIAKLGFFLQVAVKVVDVGGALAVEAGFLLDQAVGVVGQLVGFTGFVFDFGQ